MQYRSSSRNPMAMRTYYRKESIVFRRTRGEFGGLSNMAAGFSLEVNGLCILTSEALYQACRFPHLPTVQRVIIGQKSPMTAKMKSKPLRGETRADWDRVKVKIMRWCLRVKLAQNRTEFSRLLLETGERPIVEESRKDGFWGAKVADRQTLVGVNILGRLLMELRTELKQSDQDSLSIVEPLAIPEFLLDGRAIGTVFGQVDRAIDTEDALQAEPVVPGSTFQRCDIPLRPSPTQGLLFDSPQCIASRLTSFSSANNSTKSCPANSNSPVFWLGDLPEHWLVMPHRATFREIGQRGHPSHEMLSVTIARGVIKQSSLLAGTSKKDSSNEDKSEYKLVRPGDIVYNKMRAWQGAVGVSDHEGIVSPAYIVVRPRAIQHPRFFHYLFRTPAFAKEAERWSYGISSDQWSLRPEEFRQMYSCIPPLPEQNAIVRYLDYMDDRISRYINGKKKLLALLNEQKQAIIHQAVTRGLDQSVRFRPSGVDWLGEIPEYWHVRPVKWFADINSDTLSDQTDPDYVIAYLDIGAVGMGYLVEQPQRLCFGDAPSRARRIVRKDDSVISTVRTYLKATYFISQSVPNLIASTGFAVLTPRPGVLPEYLSLVIQDSPFINQIMANSVGVAYPAIDTDRLASLKIALPPSIAEQQMILGHISDKTHFYVRLMNNTQREIEVMREYRNCLVADVVTGKLDVRELAASLEEESAGGDEMDEELDSGQMLADDEPELIEETADADD